MRLTTLFMSSEAREYQADSPQSNELPSINHHQANHYQANRYKATASNHWKEELKVFVYGTLKPGECNYGRYCEGHVIDQFPAIAYGTLFDLPMGYPALVEGYKPVYGTVLHLDSPSLLETLDALEDFEQNRPLEDNEYIRIRIRVYDHHGTSCGTAWTYMMDENKAIRLGGKILSRGEWSSQLR